MHALHILHATSKGRHWCLGVITVSHTTSHYNTGRIRATHMRAALTAAARGQAKTGNRQKHRPYDGSSCTIQTWETGWVAMLAVLIILLHSTAVEEVYAFTNGFFHRPITRKRNT